MIRWPAVLLRSANLWICLARRAVTLTAHSENNGRPNSEMCWHPGTLKVSPSETGSFLSCCLCAFRRADSSMLIRTGWGWWVGGVGWGWGWREKPVNRAPRSSHIKHSPEIDSHSIEPIISAHKTCFYNGWLRTAAIVSGCN